MGSSSSLINIEWVLSGTSVVLIGGNFSNFLMEGMRWFLVVQLRKIWSALRYTCILMFDILAHLRELTMAARWPSFCMIGQKKIVFSFVLKIK